MTETNGNGRTSYDSFLPPWARLIAYLGFPIAVSVFLLGQQAGYIPSPRDQADQANKLAIAQMAKKVDDNDTAMREHRIRMEDLIRLLATGFAVMCENNAHSTADKNNCGTIRASVRYVSP